MSDTTFDQLPKNVAKVYEKLLAIEKLLLDITVVPKEQPPQEQILTIAQAAELLKLSKSTIYGLVNRRGIPVCKSNKRLYFIRTELLEWIKAGRKKTSSELNSEVETHIAQLNFNKRRQAA